MSGAGGWFASLARYVGVETKMVEEDARMPVGDRMGGDEERGEHGVALLVTRW